MIAERLITVFNSGQPNFPQEYERITKCEQLTEISKTKNIQDPDFRQKMSESNIYSIPL